MWFLDLKMRIYYRFFKLIFLHEYITFIIAKVKINECAIKSVFLHNKSAVKNKGTFIFDIEE